MPEPVIIPRAEHPISRRDIDPDALKVLYRLQQFNYTALPWSIILSLVVFKHMIDPVSLLGALVIVAAGLVVMARERIRKIPAAGEGQLPGRE